jgi:peptide/nickel transport system permease protein
VHGLRFLGRRLLQAVVTLLAVSVATFLLLRLAPGDPARIVAGPRATPEQVAAVRDHLGLDDSVVVQYTRYLGRVLQGDLGTTLNGSVDVSRIIRDNAPTTFWLATGALVATTLLSVVLATLAARRPGRAVDGAVRAFATFGMGMPSFWVGLMLLVYVAVPTGWFPIGGWPDDTAGRVRALVLPVVTLAIATSPVLIRSLRSSMIGVLDADYVKAGRSAGAHGWGLTRRFVLRNSFVPAVPLIAVLLGTLLGGTVLIEATFGLPGLGQALVTGVANRDLNVVQGITLVIAVAIVIVQLLADIVLSLIDPRVRLR